MESKTYHIPRKVGSGLTFLGLNVIDMITMVGILIVDIILIFTTSFSFMFKMVFTMISLIGPWIILTQEFGYGLRGKEYFMLLIRYNLLDQNLYSLTSGTRRSSKDKEQLQELRYKKSDYSNVLLSEREEVVLSEWDNYVKVDKAPTSDFEGLDEDQLSRIPKPKKLTRK